MSTRGALEVDDRWDSSEVQPEPDELTRVKEELRQCRLDLMQSDAIREAFVTQSVGLSRDMARALGMLEVAFLAGFASVREGWLVPDAAYRAWTASLKKE